MKLQLTALVLAILSNPVLANPEIIFNADVKRGVVDLYTDPSLGISGRYSSLSEICYKNADAPTALKEIMSLKDEGILFYDDQAEDFQEADVQGDTILITVFDSNMLDNGKGKKKAYVTWDINPCGF